MSSSYGNDLFAGTDPTKPWKTVGKVNAMVSSLNAGDRILFANGDLFQASVNEAAVRCADGECLKVVLANMRGTPAQPITIGSYVPPQNAKQSTKPVLSGAVRLPRDLVWSWYQLPNSYSRTTNIAPKVLVADLTKFGSIRKLSSTAGVMAMYVDDIEYIVARYIHACSRSDVSQLP